jgi:glycosyltransferase involved in cell wall biosynthesis
MGGFFARLNPRIFSLLTVNKPDVVIVHGYNTLTNFIVIVLSKIMNIKVILRAEATLKKQNSNTFLKSKLKYIYMKTLLSMCDVIMYSCNGNREYWKSYGVSESNMLPIPCAVDNDYFQKERKNYLNQRDQIRDSLNVNKDDFVVISVGRMIENKNFATIIESINLIDNKNIHLLLIGDGSEKKFLESLCKKYQIKSTFAGFRNISEISKFFIISDLFVLLTKYYDPSPKTLNEAMNFELPVIVTDIAGTAKDLVMEGENGYIVNPFDTKKVAEKIDFLNKNRDLSKKMGQKSLEIVNEWNFEKNAYYINKAIKMAISRR